MRCVVDTTAHASGLSSTSPAFMSPSSVAVWTWVRASPVMMYSQCNLDRCASDPPTYIPTMLFEAATTVLVRSVTCSCSHWPMDTWIDQAHNAAACTASAILDASCARQTAKSASPANVMTSPWCEVMVWMSGWKYLLRSVISSSPARTISRSIVVDSRSMNPASPLPTVDPAACDNVCIRERMVELSVVSRVTLVFILRCKLSVSLEYPAMSVNSTAPWNESDKASTASI
mmetsp:Transcript_13492/g.28684  ORF Transcript_13492/g.28684 Transcript_13492/m.28684 type:complete len:231 (+) Transcript_13492:4861-5553(+)